MLGFAPECHNVTVSNSGSASLFQQGENPSAKCPNCSPVVWEGLLGSNDTSLLIKKILPEITAINEVLGCCEPIVCLPTKTNHCSLEEIPTQWKGKFYQPFKDSLSEAAYFSEWFLLQMLNNMSLPKGLTVEGVVQLASVHMVSYLNFSSYCILIFIDSNGYDRKYCHG